MLLVIQQSLSKVDLRLVIIDGRNYFSLLARTFEKIS